MARLALISVLAVLFVASVTSPLVLGAADREKPKTIGLVEKAKAELAQIDVTVTGPSGAICGLVGQDFALTVGGKEVTDFLVDESRVPSETAPQASESAKPKPGTFLFYFDQTHLTPEGRMRSLEVARNVASRMTVGGNRVMVVSDAISQKAFCSPTSDLSAVLAALDRLENDPYQSDVSSAEEEMTVEQMDRAAEDAAADQQNLVAAQSKWSGQGPPTLDEKRGAPRSATPRQPGKPGTGLQPVKKGSTTSPKKAKPPAEISSEVREILDAVPGQLKNAVAVKAGEELKRAERGFERLTMALSYLAEVDEPKAVIFFADTLRINAGDHYFRQLARSRGGRPLAEVPMGQPRSDKTKDAVVMNPWRPRDAPGLGPSGRAMGASSFFDRVVSEAGALGIRLYTVQAQGLAAGSDRMTDAENALASLALETGGRSFLHGIPAPKIADRMLGDFSCFYLLSFDPKGFPQDEPLSVRVETRRDGATTLARSKMVIPSDESRLRSRLLGAFLRSGDVPKGIPLSASIVPLGYEDGAFSGLVQIVVQSSDLPRIMWELGATAVSGGEGRNDAAGRVGAAQAKVPVVLESTMRFKPGAFEVVAVARDTATDRIASRRLGGTWPDPDSAAASVTSIAVLQPASGAFLANGESKSSGSIAYALGDPIRGDLPTALVGLVCSDGKQNGPLHLERRLSGETSVEFPAMDLDLGEDRCAQVRDLIPTGTLGPGRFRYEVHVARGAQELAKAERRFTVVAGPKEEQKIGTAAQR